MTAGTKQDSAARDFQFEITRSFRILLVFVLAFVVPASGFPQNITIGTVEQGSVDNQWTIAVTNQSPGTPINNLQVSVSGQPRLLTDWQIEVARDPLHPKESRIVTVKFDVRDDAKPGDSETLILRVSADPPTKFDFSDPRLTVTIAPRSTETPVAGRPAERDSPTPPSSGQSPSVPVVGSPSRASEAYDYYLITIQGTGVVLHSPVSLERRKGSDDFIRQLKRGESVETLLASIRRSVAQPWCEGVHTRPVDFYEDSRVEASGPFAKYEDAAIRLRGDTWKTVETVAIVSPEEVLRQWGCVARGGTASRGNPQGGSAATAPVTGAGPSAGDSARVDSNALNPNAANISGLIQSWIAMAEPPDNVKGARLKYDEWGRMQGTGIDQEVITSGRRPEAAGGISSPQYLWTLRDQLDSIDHCTLGRFVIASLQNQSVDDCRGRYKKAPPQLLSVPDMAGRNWQAAQADLQRAGFQVDLVGGDPAATKAEENSVQWQKPASGTQVAAGSKIQIAVRSNYVAPARSVPDVMGRSVSEAQDLLQRAGFKVDLAGGDPAPSSDRAFTVQAQRPSAGSDLEIGALVTLRLYSGYAAPQPIAEPPVRGNEGGPALERPAGPDPQVAQRCSNLLKGGDAAYHARRLQEALNLYREARQLRCPAPNIDGAISGVEGEIQQQNQQNQRSQQCNGLLQQGNEARRAANDQAALNAYYQARNSGCQAEGLNQTIAEIERTMQQAQQCGNFVQLGDIARSTGQTQQAITFYQQAQQSGCGSPQLDRNIADLNRSIQQAQQCQGLLQGGDAASNVQRHDEALRLYRQARQSGCNAPNLDNAIANLERHVQQQQEQARHAQQCGDLIQRGNQANSANLVHDALRLYVQARDSRCNTPGLDQAIAGLESRLRQVQTKAVPPPPPNRPTFGVPSPARPVCPPGQVPMMDNVLGQGNVVCVVPRR